MCYAIVGICAACSNKIYFSDQKNRFNREWGTWEIHLRVFFYGFSYYYVVVDGGGGGGCIAIVADGMPHSLDPISSCVQSTHYYTLALQL